MSEVKEIARIKAASRSAQFGPCSVKNEDFHCSASRHLTCFRSRFRSVLPERTSREICPPRSNDGFRESRAAARVSLPGRGCVKTPEAHCVRCIFGHVRSISGDLFALSFTLSQLHGITPEFLHTLGRLEPFAPARSPSHCTARSRIKQRRKGIADPLPRLHLDQRHTRVGPAQATGLTAGEQSGTVGRASALARYPNPGAEHGSNGARRQSDIAGG
jgi:hypothetical protein